MKTINKAIIGVLVTFVFLPPAEAGWKKLRNKTGNITGIYLFAQNNREISMDYYCSSGDGMQPNCRLYLAIALTCDITNGPVSIPIQYGDKLTKAKLECMGLGYGIQEGAGSVRNIYSASRIKKQTKNTKKLYSWAVTLPGQGSGPVPVITEKKLVFIFQTGDKDYRYTFSMKGAEKAMEAFYQSSLDK